MKVYVDELPKSCSDCVFCKQTEYCYYCDKLHTKLGYFDKDTDCPLISLSEHNKQVRKEVVQEIRKQLKEVEKFHPEDDFEIDYDYYYKEDIDEILDKLEKGE